MSAEKQVKLLFKVDEPSLRVAQTAIRDLIADVSRLVETTQRVNLQLGHLTGNQLQTAVGGMAAGGGQPTNPNTLVQTIKAQLPPITTPSLPGMVPPGARGTMYMSMQAQASMLAQAASNPAPLPVQTAPAGVSATAAVDPVVRKLDEIASLLRQAIGGGARGAGAGVGVLGGGGGTGAPGEPAGGGEEGGGDPTKPTSLLGRFFKGQIASRMVGFAGAQLGLHNAAGIASSALQGWSVAGPWGAAIAGGFEAANRYSQATQDARVGELAYRSQAIMNPMAAAAGIGSSMGVVGLSMKRGDIAMGHAFRRAGAQLAALAQRERDDLEAADITTAGKYGVKAAGERLEASVIANLTDTNAQFERDRQIAREQVKSRIAQERAQIVHDQMAADPETTALLNEIGAGSKSEMGLMRAARMGGRFRVTRNADGSVSSAGLSPIQQFEVTAEKYGYDAGALAGIRQQIARTAGSGYMGNYLQVAGLQAGGLSSAADLLGMGAQYGGGPQSFINAIQRSIGAGGVDVSTGDKMASVMASMLQSGLTTGASFMGTGAQQLMGFAKGGSSGDQMRAISEMARGLGSQASIFSGAKSPWYQYQMTGAAVSSFAGGADSTFTRDWVMKLQRNPMAAEGLLREAEEYETKTGQVHPELARQGIQSASELRSFKEKAISNIASHLTPEYIRKTMGRTEELSQRGEQFIKFQGGREGREELFNDRVSSLRKKYGKGVSDDVIRGLAGRQLAREVSEVYETLTPGSDPAAAAGMYMSALSDFGVAGGGRGTGDSAGGRAKAISEAKAQELAERLKKGNRLLPGEQAALDLYRETHTQGAAALADAQGAANGAAAGARDVAQKLMEFAGKLDQLNLVTGERRSVSKSTPSRVQAGAPSRETVGNKF